MGKSYKDFDREDEDSNLKEKRERLKEIQRQIKHNSQEEKLSANIYI